MCRTAVFVAARALAGLNSMRMVYSVIGSSLIVAPVPATSVEVDRSSSGGGGGRRSVRVTMRRVGRKRHWRDWYVEPVLGFHVEA